MSGEVAHAKELVQAAMNDAQFDRDTMGRALLNAVIGQFAEYRDAADIQSELEFIIENLGEDEFVITRGC